MPVVKSQKCPEWIKGIRKEALERPQARALGESLSVIRMADAAGEGELGGGPPAAGTVAAGCTVSRCHGL